VNITLLFDKYKSKKASFQNSNLNGLLKSDEFFIQLASEEQAEGDDKMRLAGSTATLFPIAESQNRAPDDLREILVGHP
jgi:hypothetical protein